MVVMYKVRPLCGWAGWNTKRLLPQNDQMGHGTIRTSIFPIPFK